MPRARACITDPPYNVGVQYGDGVNDKRPDYASWCGQWLSSCRAKCDAVAFTPGTTNVAMWCRLAEPDWIVCWHKPACMGNSPFGVCNWEPVLFYGAPRRNSGNDVIVAPIVREPELWWHPCPKPEKLAAGLILLTTQIGDTIIDVFAGSGTTLVAAKRLGRRAIGVEVEERFCERIAARLSRTTVQVQMTLPIARETRQGLPFLENRTDGEE